MTESKSKRDLYEETQIAYIGDDTGLIKKVKLVAKREEHVHSIEYGQDKQKKKRDKFRASRAGLTEADDFHKKTLTTEFAFKLISKYGEQVKNQGISCASWTSDMVGCISLVRGKAGIVQVFDTNAEAVVQQKDLSGLFPHAEKKHIVGLHSLGAKTHFVIDHQGNCIKDNLGSKKVPSKPDFQVKGNHVLKSVQESFGSPQNVAVCSKDTTLQLWDVNKAAMVWKAKNVPNDELDLAIPIWDSDLAFLSARVFVTSTGLGQVRHYDSRASTKCTSTAQVTKNEMLLSHILPSKRDPNLLYVVSQEGHPIVLDRRFNCRVIRKIPGSKGSVRGCALITKDDMELLLTIGCDRHLRVFDAAKAEQSACNVGSAYLKQKLNTILLQRE